MHHKDESSERLNKMSSAWLCSILILASSCLPVLLAQEDLHCNSLSTPDQRELCRETPDLPRILLAAEHQARIECEKVFAHEPWNCSDFSVITPSVVMQYPTKEAAYMFSLMSASIAHVTAGLCVLEEGHTLPCGCSEMSMSFPTPDPNTVIIPGCSFNVSYGLELSKQFMDEFELYSSDLEKFPYHNNRAGRFVLENSTVTACICHGVSAGCTLQTCQIELEQFSSIAQRLFDLYERSCEVTAHESLCGHIPAGTELIYFAESPDYCIRNPSKGSPGVQGRSCDPHIQGKGSCSEICCGRGYHSVTEEFIEPCQCHFIWCCQYICDECRWDETRYFCL